MNPFISYHPLLLSLLPIDQLLNCNCLRKFSDFRNKTNPTNKIKLKSMDNLTLNFIENRSPRQCSCFADECPDWPVRLFTHGIMRPLLAFVQMICCMAALRTLTNFCKWQRQMARDKNGWVNQSTPKLIIDSRYQSVSNRDSIFADMEQNRDVPIKIGKQRLITMCRITLRALLCHGLIESLEFFRTEAAIFNYPYNTTHGLILCYLVLFLFNFAYRINRTFLELYTCGAVLEISITNLLTLLRRKRLQNSETERGETQKKKSIKRPSVPMPLATMCGTQSFAGFCIILATSLNFMSVINYDCVYCHDSSIWKNSFYEIARDRERRNSFDFIELNKFYSTVLCLANGKH